MHETAIFPVPLLRCFIQPPNTWGKIMKVGGHVASAKREPIMGVWGSRIQGHSPWWRTMGGRSPL